MIDLSDFLSQPFDLDGGGSSETSAMDMLQQYATAHHFELSPVEIVQSVEEASAFFNIDMPAEIHYGQMTGVCNHMASTMTDDVLFISEQQMTDMGITGKEAFDLVMTHEGAHRALQGLDTHFNDHQEELCCDMLAGVRAGLNDITDDAIDAMKASLKDTMESVTHPAGAVRVEIIDEGIAFAQEYYAAHHCAPSLYECIDHFNEVQGLQDVNDIHGLVTLRPDDAPEAVKAYSKDEINSRMHKAERDMNYWKAQWESHLKLAKHDMWQESEMAHARSCQRKYEAARQEYNHWRNEKPDAVKGYTSADIDWLEKQVRISSGSEQAHWLDKLVWAKKHLHGFSFESTDSVEFNDMMGADTLSFSASGGFTEEEPMFTYEQLRDAGFSDAMAMQIVNPDMPHSYSRQELHDVLYSANPLEAYNQMMDTKAQAAINRADAIGRQIGRDFGIFATI